MSASKDINSEVVNSETDGVINGSKSGFDRLGSRHIPITFLILDGDKSNVNVFVHKDVVPCSQD